jgi:hypothetical protein
MAGHLGELEPEKHVAEGRAVLGQRLAELVDGGAHLLGIAADQNDQVGVGPELPAESLIALLYGMLGVQKLGAVGGEGQAAGRDHDAHEHAEQSHPYHQSRPFEGDFQIMTKPGFHDGLDLNTTPAVPVLRQACQRPEILRLPESGIRFDTENRTLALLSKLFGRP